MGNIETRVSREGKTSYRARVRVRGYPPQYATFDTKTAARHWAQRTEADLREDRHFPGAKAKKYTVADLIDAYLENLKTVIRLCGSEGSIVTYNQAFEQGVNEDLMRDYPAHADSIRAINARMVDLLVPFRKRWLYHPSQNGSASIKKVLPAFTDLSYDGMSIGNGQDASQQYADFMQGKLSPDEQAVLWQNLSAYCGLDTLAMKALVDVLKSKAA